MVELKPKTKHGAPAVAQYEKTQTCFSFWQLQKLLRLLCNFSCSSFSFLLLINIFNSPKVGLVFHCFVFNLLSTHYPFSCFISNLNFLLGIGFNKYGWSHFRFIIFCINWKKKKKKDNLVWFWVSEQVVFLYILSIWMSITHTHYHVLYLI